MNIVAGVVGTAALLAIGAGFAAASDGALRPVGTVYLRLLGLVLAIGLFVFLLWCGISILARAVVAVAGSADSPEDESPTANARRRRGKWTGAALVVTVVVGWLYLHGTFDRALYSAGLNWNECASNGFGATFCGDDLDRYRERVVEPAREAEAELEQLQREAAAEEARFRELECLEGLLAAC